MRRSLLPLICLVFALQAAAAIACPVLPDRSAKTDPLFSALRQSGGPAEALPIADALWQVWTTAPDEVAQALLDQGMDRREAYDFAGSTAVLDELVAYCPDYAEGFNQRAFSRFLTEDFEGALADIDRVLEIEPRHFGALSGKALALIRLGRAEQAQAALRRAVKVHPWLAERRMLTPQKDI